MKTYEPGEPITTEGAFNFVLDMAIKAPKDERPYWLIYVKNWDKAVSPIVISNMAYNIVRRWLESGQFSLAKKIKEASDGREKRKI